MSSHVTICRNIYWVIWLWISHLMTWCNTHHPESFLPQFYRFTDSAYSYPDMCLLRSQNINMPYRVSKASNLHCYSPGGAGGLDMLFLCLQLKIAQVYHYLYPLVVVFLVSARGWGERWGIYIVSSSNFMYLSLSRSSALTGTEGGKNGGQLNGEVDEAARTYRTDAKRLPQGSYLWTA